MYRLVCEFVGGYGQKETPGATHEDVNELQKLESSFYRTYSGWSGGCRIFEEKPENQPQNSPSGYGSFHEDMYVRLEMPLWAANLVDSVKGRDLVRVYFEARGWAVVYVAPYSDGIEIYVSPRGTDPITLSVIGLLAIVAIVVGIFFLKYTIASVSENRTIQAAEATERAAISNLRELIESPNVSEETKKMLGEKLAEIAGDAVQKPANIPASNSGGLLEGVGIGGGIALLGFAYFLTQKKGR